MRKQYHFRKIGNDTYIWDVHHLLELTKNFKVKEIPLSAIMELKEPYWYPDSEPPRDCRRPNILREYDNENTKLHS